MIRILQIGLSYEYGGIESFVINYYRNINKDNVQFDFINPYDKPLAYEEEIISLGGNVYKIPDFHKSPNEYKMELKKIMEKYRVVHVHMLSAANLIPLQVARKSKVKKIIAHSHNTKAEGVLRTILHQLNYKKIAGLATDFFACSQEAGKWLFGENVAFKVIKNAIMLEEYSFDLETRRKKRKELGVDDATIVFANVGRLNVQKNQEFLMEIFAEILNQESNSRLCIVGDGELKESLTKKARELEIIDKVFLLGRRSDVKELYNAFDVIIMPSLFEGLPITLVEAQANGLKCYASEGNIPAEIKVIDSMEFVSLTSKPEVWAKKILSQKNVRKIDAAKQLRMADFDIRIEVNKLEQIYCNV